MQTPTGTSGAVRSSRAGSPQSRGGPLIRRRAQPSMKRRSRRPRRGAAPAGRRAGDPGQFGAAGCARQGDRRTVGEREIATGYVGQQGGQPLLCRLTTEPESWRALLLATHRAESEVLAHSDFPVDDLRRELGITEPSFETVFDPTGNNGDLSEDTVFWVGTSRHDDQLALTLRYRTDVLDADCAARIAGYHLVALELMVADLDAEHRRQSLLSAEELHFQLEGLAGRRRALPDCRVHELFEQQVESHPDTVAAVHGTRQWTYRELNGRANRLARALLARGLRREGVVAVVAERNLDWLAAVLAIFKAGGVYLPIEPHFPADRIATMLGRAGCGLVLTEPAAPPPSTRP